jgi:hypothetical protein
MDTKELRERAAKVATPGTFPLLDDLFSALDAAHAEVEEANAALDGAGVEGHDNLRQRIVWLNNARTFECRASNAALDKYRADNERLNVEARDLRILVAGHAAAVEAAYREGYNFGFIEGGMDGVLADADYCWQNSTARAALASKEDKPRPERHPDSGLVNDWAISTSKPATPAPAQREGKVCDVCYGLVNRPCSRCPVAATCTDTVNCPPCPSCNGTGREP